MNFVKIRSKIVNDIDLYIKSLIYIELNLSYTNVDSKCGFIKIFHSISMPLNLDIYKSGNLKFSIVNFEIFPKKILAIIFNKYRLLIN